MPDIGVGGHSGLAAGSQTALMQSPGNVWLFLFMSGQNQVATRYVDQRKVWAKTESAAGIIAILKALAVPVFVMPMLLQSCAERDTDVALGILMRERVVLTATANAILKELPVAEGNPVTAGDVLAQIEAAVQQANLQLANARLAEAEADLTRVRSGARDQEVAIAEARVRGARAVYEEAETTLERNRRLLESGTITQARLDQDVTLRNLALAELTSAEQALGEISEGARYEDKDVEFRNRSDNRGLRRRLDYSKAETLLEEHGVADHRGKRRTLSLQDFNLPKLRYNLSCFSHFPAIADPPIAEQMASSWWTTFRGLLQQNPANDAESDLC